MIKIDINQHKFEKYIATIGNFDGLHLGHVKLLSNMSQYATQNNLGRLIITFEPLTHEFLCIAKKTEVQSRLSLIRDKIRYIQGQKLADKVLIIRFNREMMSLSPHQFIHKITDKFSLDTVMVGHDFKFGYKTSGTILDFSKENINTLLCDDFLIESNKASSTNIRELLSNNKLDKAYAMLGHSLCYTSRVVKGNQLGRKFGVPTINLNLGFRRPAVWGVYFAYVHIEGNRYNAVASIGKNPTVSDSEYYKLEAHLIDVNMDLYGKIATIEFLEFLRPELKFNNLDELFVAIADDLLQTRKFFAEKI